MTFWNSHQYNTIQYIAIQYNTIQYNTIQKAFRRHLQKAQDTYKETWILQFKNYICDLVYTEMQSTMIKIKKTKRNLRKQFLGNK